MSNTNYHFKGKTIVIGVNTLTSVDQAVYSNHCQFWYRLGKEFPDYRFILIHPRRMSIDSMRNMAAKVAVDANADYLMFVDDDVILPLDTMKRLLACDADIAAGWTIIRGYPFENMFFQYGDEARLSLMKPKNPVAAEDGLFHVDAVGFSCVLIKVSLLKKVPVPYFVTGPFHTEDVYFCIKAEHELRKTGNFHEKCNGEIVKLIDPTDENHYSYQCNGCGKKDIEEDAIWNRLEPETVKIVVDPEVKTAHCLGTHYIDPDNVTDYRALEEAANKDIAEIVAKKEEKDATTPSVIVLPPVDGLTYEQILKDEIFGKG